MKFCVVAVTQTRFQKLYAPASVWVCVYKCVFVCACHTHTHTLCGVRW